MKIRIRKPERNIVMAMHNVIVGVVTLGLLWLLPVIWVSLDSSHRNISPVFWTVVTLLSGVLGLIGYGVVRELLKKMPENL